MIDISCHVTNWFADFVTGALNPALGWIAGIAFGIPPVPDGVAGLWAGTQTVVNLLFVLLVLAAGGVVMGRSALAGAQHQAGEMLGRLAFAFIASNTSLWLSREIFTAANGVSRGVAAMSIDPEVSVERLRERMDSVLMEGVVFFVLLLVVIAVLAVVWIVIDVVRIVMSIVLVIAAPLLLAFHALPQTNGIAVLWWRSMAALCAIPIAQSLAFSAMMKLFFEGQLRFFGHYDLAVGQTSGGPVPTMAVAPMMMPADPADGTTPLFDLLLFLVLVYIQIRIPMWAMKLVWAPTPGRSPAAALAKGVAFMLLFRSIRAARLAHKPGPAASPAASPLRGTVQPWGPRLRVIAGPVHGPGAPSKPIAPGGGSAGGPAGRGDRPRPRPSTDPPEGLQQAGAGRGTPRSSRTRLMDHQSREGRPALRPAQSAKDDPTRKGQLCLFDPAVPERRSSPSPRRWRQGVLPTPPPQRDPARRGPKRLGELFDAPPQAPRRPRPVRGQIPLFANPKKHWVQRPLPLGRVGFTDNNKKAR